MNLSPVIRTLEEALTFLQDRNSAEGQFSAIRGSWHAGDNLAYIARTGNPLTTWTGQQAARHGLGNATRGDHGFLPGTADGMDGGEYEWVEFLFRR